MDYDYNTTSSISFGQLSFIRVEFEVGHITPEEECELNNIIAKAILPNPPEPAKPVAPHPKSLRRPSKFCILYDEESDTEKIDRLFFKLKLQYPEFKILDGVSRLSLYS